MITSCSSEVFPRGKSGKFQSEGSNFSREHYCLLKKFMFAFWVVSSRSRHNSLGICQCGRANYLSSKAKIDQKTGNVSFEDADENLDVDTWKHHGGYHDDPPHGKIKCHHIIPHIFCSCIFCKWWGFIDSLRFEH